MDERAKSLDGEPILTISSALHGERTWRRVGIRDYLTSDVRQVGLAVWESECAVCGARFQIAAPMGAASIEQSASFGLTTCPAHRMTPSEAGRLSVANLDDRRWAFECIKRQKLNRGPQTG